MDLSVGFRESSSRCTFGATHDRFCVVVSWHHIVLSRPCKDPKTFCRVPSVQKIVFDCFAGLKCLFFWEICEPNVSFQTSKTQVVLLVFTWHAAPKPIVLRFVRLSLPVVSVLEGSYPYKGYYQYLISSYPVPTKHHCVVLQLVSPRNFRGTEVEDPRVFSKVQSSKLMKHQKLLKTVEKQRSYKHLKLLVKTQRKSPYPANIGRFSYEVR